MKNPISPNPKSSGLATQAFFPVMIGSVVGFLLLSLGGAPYAWGQAVDKITTSPKVYSLNPCEQKEFKATVKGKDGKAIKDAKIVWESTNPGVATIDKNGVATGRTPGYTFIRPKVGQTKGETSSLFIRNKGVPPKC